MNETVSAAPTPLRIAGVLVLLEALTLIVLSVAELFSLTSTRAAMGVSTSLFFVVYAVAIGLCVAEALSVSVDKLVMGATTAAFFLLYGVALGVFAWLLRQRRSWPRAPVVLTQLLQLGLAWSLRGGVTTVAVALAVVALAVLAGVFHPASLAALEPDSVDERA